MHPVNFKWANCKFNRPPSMTDEECAPLYVCRTDNHLISCWRLSWSDLWRLLWTRTIWLWVTGAQHPPVSLDVNDPGFYEKKEQGE